MAQKVSIILTDDLTGEEADLTAKFSLDGTDYEIDLTNDNALKLRDVLAPFIGAARTTQRRRGRPVGTAAVAAASTGRRSRKEVTSMDEVEAAKAPRAKAKAKA